ncbi:MAG: KEOPS complex subunit Cgi121 [Candidatus Thermoplasmatota archaeon]|nr:KEOPS complex subunit Cgi121 [Candidatus Thermoplasmatota archaeon]
MFSIIAGRLKGGDKFLKIKNFSSKSKVKIAALNADIIIGKEHLVSACNHAIKAFERGKNIANKLENEILLYVCGERQIARAIAKAGIKRTTERVALVIVGKCSIAKLISELGLQVNNKILESNITQKLKKFKFSKEEINACTNAKDLILERIALLKEGD